LDVKGIYYAIRSDISEFWAIRKKSKSIRCRLVITCRLNTFINHFRFFVYMLRIILDTNFLLIPLQFKVDIFAEVRRLLSEPYELYVYQGTIDELNDLAKGNSKAAVTARTAIKLIKQKNLKSLPNSINEKYADTLILEGVTNKDIVCTQDQALKRLLKDKHKGIRLMALKSKKYLDFE